MNPDAPSQDANANSPQPPIEQPTPEVFQAQNDTPPSVQPTPQPVFQPPQQEPVVQPTQFQQPQPSMQPAVQAPVMTTVPKKKLSKNVLIGIIAGAAVLVLGLIVALAIIFAGPSKADYKQAMDTTESAREAWSKMAGVYVSSSSTQTELTNSVDTMKDARTDLYKQLDVLAKNKAITADKDVKEKWQVVLDKKTKLDAALSARIEAYETIYPIVISMDSSPSTQTEARAMLVDAQAKMSAITGLTDENNKKYVERIKSDLDKLIVVIDKVIVMRQDPSKYDSTVMNTYYDLTTDLTDADRDWASTSKKQMDDSDIRKEMTSLSEAISDKYYKLK
jgi:hypothetical protein